MHDAFGMRGVERVSDLNPEIENLFELQRRSRDALPQCRPSRYSMAKNGRPSA